MDLISLNPARLGLADALENGQPITVAFGGGVNSYAILVALKAAGIRPDHVTFADTGHEKRATYAAVEAADKWLRSWANVGIETVQHRPQDSTPYDSLGGNCLENETLPSVSFPGRGHSCAVKWKKTPQEYAWRGCSGSGNNARPPHPLFLDCQKRGIKAVRLIGYDYGSADQKRARKASTYADDSLFDNRYPLLTLEWDRAKCKAAIAAEGLDVPPKSSCTFCAASKLWELWHMAEHEPEALTYALRLEHNALTGKHSRWKDVEFGRAWIDYVKTGDRFPSAETSCGLGIRFSWCQWAFTNGLASPENGWEIRPLSSLVHEDDPGTTEQSAKPCAQMELF